MNDIETPDEFKWAIAGLINGIIIGIIIGAILTLSLI